MDINRVTQMAGDRIAAAFVRSGLSKQRLSEETGIPYATLSRRFKRGGWTLSEAFSLSAAFGINIVDLLDDVQPMPVAA